MQIVKTIPIWSIIVFPIGSFFFATILHEFSHCVAVWSLGGRIREFKIWPHRCDGQLVLGSITHDTPKSYKSLRIYIAPLITSIFLFCLSFTLGFFFFPIWFISVWELTDALGWVEEYIECEDTGDGGKYRRLKCSVEVM